MHSPTQSPVADWIISDDQLATWLAGIPADAVVGVDTEFMRRDTFYPQLALLQLAHDGRYALIDPLAFDAGPRLQALLGAQPTVSVMHSASEDLEALAPLLPKGPHTLFDTQIAAAFAGMGAGLSYRALVAELIGDELDKGETRSDWLQRPLTPSQLAYAALDVVHLHRIHALLSERLAERGRTEWFAEDCRRLLQRAGNGGDAQPQKTFKGASDWAPERQALLRRILRWRDAAARSLNKPRPWLVDDNLAMSLASNLPHSQDDLDTRGRGQRALRSAQRRELFELVHEPVTAEEIAATQGIPGHPFGEAKRVITAMKAVVEATAVELDLPAGMLCARRNLDDYVVTREWPEGLIGWRHEVLYDRLAPLLPETA
jgi:ribonuclease D